MLLVGFQGAGMYHGNIKKTEDDIQNILKRVNELTGIKESDTGLAPPAHWDLAADKQILQSTSHNLILLLPRVQEHNTQLENLPYQVSDGMQFFSESKLLPVCCWPTIHFAVPLLPYYYYYYYY